MGEAKQLLQFRGKPLVRYVAETALAAGCSPVVVVLGANHEAVGGALAGLPVVTAVNHNWAAGMGGSIQTGLRAVEASSAEAAILALADQPFVGEAFFRTLISEQARTGVAIVAATYSGTVGVPVLFAREAWPELHALPPEQGCKGVILKNQQASLLMDCPDAAKDIDTPDDYARAVAGD